MSPDSPPAGEANEYDVWGRVSRTVTEMTVGTKSGEAVLEFAYYPDGLRRSKTVTFDGIETTTIYVWDENGQLVAELDGQYRAVRQYDRIGSKVVRGILDGNVKYYYMYNAHGDVTGLADRAGKVVERYAYGPFGELVEGNPRGMNPLRYCGEYTDFETGQIYLRARMYAPKTGRFTQEDPAMDGTNWYVYCTNNPINFVDPNGEDAIWITTSEDSVYGQGHSSILVQDTRAGKWYYFYWGNKATYFVEVPWQNGAMNSLEAFNAWNTGMGLRDNSTNYTTATFIEGDFNASVDYFKNLVANTEIRFMKVHEKTDQNGNIYYENEFKNMSYDLLTNNCLHQSFNGFGKGTLRDGTNAGQFVGSVKSIRPNDARRVFKSMFFNQRFSRAAARNDVEWEAKYGYKPKWYDADNVIRYHVSGMKYARSIGVI